MPRKRLIVCLDGTWNTAEPAPGADLTNAARLLRALRPLDEAGVHQVVFYVPGLGTRGRLDYVLSGYTGRGLSGKIRDAYRFLAENYAPGDELYIFGASRGGFAARSLSGLIGFCGLLNKVRLWRLPEAYELFVSSDPRRETPELASLRRDSAFPLEIRMIGAWDTVEALGLPLPGLRQWTRPRVGFHDSRLSPLVRNAFHALALEERRSIYRPALWPGPSAPGQRIEQVWFRGTHVDVCGGFGKRGLADIALGWMVEKARQCGLAFEQSYLDEELQPNPEEAPSEPSPVWRLLTRYSERPALEISPETESIHPSALACSRPLPPRLARLLEQENVVSV